MTVGELDVGLGILRVRTRRDESGNAVIAQLRVGDGQPDPPPLVAVGKSAAKVDADGIDAGLRHARAHPTIERRPASPAGAPRLDLSIGAPVAPRLAFRLELRQRFEPIGIEPSAQLQLRRPHLAIDLRDEQQPLFAGGAEHRPPGSRRIAGERIKHAQSQRPRLGIECRHDRQ